MNVSRPKKCLGSFLPIVFPCLLLLSSVASAEPVLDVVIGGQTRQFGRDELLRRPDVTEVAVANDVAYGKSMHYRAVPVAALLVGLNPPADSVIESIALDGFAAHLPFGLLTNKDPAKPIAWVAIEPADRPWPPLPGKTLTAGPFYIVWTGASAATIRSEQWPYQLARLESQLSPLVRWPALDVDPGLPATDPTRAGLALFVTQCLPCHTLNGAGSSSFGPDLNRPMNPTQYLTLNGLRALIRDPKSLRSWPAQQMPGFTAEQMSDREIDMVIGYLKHMAARDGNRAGASRK
jgi:mono/diheme cytochrome c family protein